ncbi:radical SAM protein [Thermoanaerobacterium thermosaccharolyticum]|uniref:radical SAM protein n=1 Tax=Thermoanaerobacterium thermosaccharolyticum TaxID=1517 RepID=UPI0032C45959
MLSFYGGEPLLNWDVINLSIDYARTFRSDCEISFTTNATLLTDEIISKIVHSKINITISLDGPQILHDANRVFANGAGTFELVMKNIKKLISAWNEYWGEQFRVPIICCINKTTDLNMLVNFFNDYRDILNVVRLQTVDVYGTHFYDDFSPEELDTYYNGFKQIINNIMSGRGTIFEKKVIENTLYLIDQRNIINVSNIGNTCPPGAKMAVDTNGLIHMCEKVNANYPFGNINLGIDWDKAATLLNLYLEARYKNCSLCKVTRLCPSCFSAWVTDSKKLEINTDLCNDIKRNVITYLTLLYNMMEEGIMPWWN